MRRPPGTIAFLIVLAAAALTVVALVHVFELPRDCDAHPGAGEAVLTLAVLLAACAALGAGIYLIVTRQRLRFVVAAMSVLVLGGALVVAFVEVFSGIGCPTI